MSRFDAVPGARVLVLRCLNSRHP